MPLSVYILKEPSLSAGGGKEENMLRVIRNSFSLGNITVTIS